MMSARQGPVYMCYDAGLQESQLNHDIQMPPEGAIHVPVAPSADPAALEKAADTLAAANRVAIIADFAARPPHGWNHVVELAETLGASVWDVNSRLNFPSDHPLNLTSDPEGCYKDVDAVLSLGIEGKRLLWRALGELQNADGSLAGFDCRNNAVGDHLWARTRVSGY